MTAVVAVDVGNSRIKWALHDALGWSCAGFANTDDPALDSVLREAWSSMPGEAVWIAANVAGAGVAQIIERVASGGVRFVVPRGQQCGVRNGYLEPAQLGVDRWCALIGAHRAAASAPRDQLVVMVGTAITIDALTADGQFLGGTIVPGLRLMRQALHTGTAQLPAQAGGWFDFPRATQAAIGTGVIDAAVGAVRQVYERFSAQRGGGVTCVVGGGDAVTLAPHLQAFGALLHIDETLVLSGLVAIAHSEAA